MTAPLRRNGKLVAVIERSCATKVRYNDDIVARAVGQIEQRAAGYKLYIYPCPICRGWHLTKQPQRKDSHHVDYVFPRTRYGT